MTTPTAANNARIEHIVTSGEFCLDGGCWDVDNNIWLIGNDDEVIIIDAPHEAAPIIDAVGARRVKAIVLTHGHNDHINVAHELASTFAAPIWLHPDDRMLWDQIYDHEPDHELTEGTVIEIGGIELLALHTPGHSPGSVSLYSSALGAVFSGDTLFNGGPGATGRSYSDFPTIIESIRTKLLTLPSDTTVYTGHGDQTVIGNEAPNLQAWIDRGH